MLWTDRSEASLTAALINALFAGAADLRAIRWLLASIRQILQGTAN
jgi:hypothetical protein